MNNKTEQNKTGEGSNAPRTTKITLKRLGETKYGDMQWSHAEFTITRRHWVLPHHTMSYVVERNGKRVVGDFDTLAEVRDYISEIRADEGGAQ
jgi:hypothetical protein